jgi:DNA-binding MurR/RpiR family transcriptional regulator
MYGRTPHNYIDIQINEVVNVILNNNEIKMIELSKFFDVGESTMLKKIHNFGYKGINELKQKVINEKNK